MDLKFQDMTPETFVVLAEALGNAWSMDLPFNQQNSIGNWLQLLGQVILTFNAQQQYFEQGPGKRFNPASKNIDNPDCAQNGGDSSSNGTDANCSDCEQKCLQELQKMVEELSDKVDSLEQKLQYYEKQSKL